MVSFFHARVVHACCYGVSEPPFGPPTRLSLTLQLLLKILGDSYANTRNSYLRILVSRKRCLRCLLTKASVSNETYACMTLHFISQSFDLVNMPFNIRKMDGHTTGPDIAADVASMCAEVGVSPTCIVTDCEPAMVASWRLMNHGAQGCSDHRLEKVACKIFNSPLHAAALKKARKVAGRFHMSSQASAIDRQVDACTSYFFLFLDLLDHE